MSYRDYAPSAPLLFGYDPERDLPKDHLARLVERVVEESIKPGLLPARRGQPPFDPRLCAKVLLYGYATGTRSSRQLERLCTENLAYLYLTRGDAPSYRTLCSFRVQHAGIIEQVWVAIFAVAREAGIARLGRITVDSTKLRADAGPESVVRRDEYDRVLTELKAILTEAEAADNRDESDPPGTSRLGKVVDGEQMRDILRRVRGSRKAAGTEDEDADHTEERKAASPFMLPRIHLAVAAIEAAQEEGLKHACLTDPDARMMAEGREKAIRECHSFEVAVAGGLVVAGQATQTGQDAPRLRDLVEAARKSVPEGIVSVDADSGYYSGEVVAALIKEGVDVCIPDSSTACDLHRAQPVGTTRQKTTGSVEFVYDREQDVWTCPQSNTLAFRREIRDCGQRVRIYRARQNCGGCPLNGECGNTAGDKRREIKVGVDHEILRAHTARFQDPDHVHRYHQRGHAVETKFGVLRSVLRYVRWMVRGRERVAAEARLITSALQLRTVHCRWAAAQ